MQRVEIGESDHSACRIRNISMLRPPYWLAPCLSERPSNALWRLKRGWSSPHQGYPDTREFGYPCWPSSRIPRNPKTAARCFVATCYKNQRIFSCGYLGQANLRLYCALPLVGLREVSGIHLRTALLENYLL